MLSAPLCYFVHQIVFSQQIVYNESNELNYGIIATNETFIGDAISPQRHHAIIYNTIEANNQSGIDRRQPKPFVVPQFFRQLKENVRSKTPKMLQTVKEYCEKNLGVDSRLRDVNENYKGRIYFDVFHNFAYCQLTKVRACHFMAAVCVILFTGTACV